MILLYSRLYLAREGGRERLLLLHDVLNGDQVDRLEGEIYRLLMVSFKRSVT